MPVSYKRKNSMKKSKSSKGSKSSKLSKRVKTRKSTKTKKRLTRKSKKGSVVRKMRGGDMTRDEKEKLLIELIMNKTSTKEIQDTLELEIKALSKTWRTFKNKYNDLKETYFFKTYFF